MVSLLGFGAKEQAGVDEVVSGHPPPLNAFFTRSLGGNLPALTRELRGGRSPVSRCLCSLILSSYGPL